MASHYETLEVSSCATLADIRRAYHRLAIVHHPDKSGDDATSSTAAADAFQAIQRAWEVLKDDASRGAYDRQLASARARQQVSVSDDVQLEDCYCEALPAGEDGVEDNYEYNYPCRCSALYVFYEKDIEHSVAQNGAMQMVVGCSGCSLNIRVHFDTLNECEVLSSDSP